VCDYKSRSMHACRNTLLSQCVRVRECRNPRRGHEEMGWRLFVPTNMSPLLQKQTNVHKKQGPDTHTQRALCSITLLAGLTSARMHKHANEKRAGAVHSHACSNACSGTRACVSGVVACVSDPAAAPKATHSTRGHKHAGQRGQGTRTMRGPCCCVQSEQHAS